MKMHTVRVIIFLHTLVIQLNLILSDHLRNEECIVINMADETCDEENQEQFDIYGPLLSNHIFCITLL
jgi:hypothetical protein